jgi:hypothetical protein
MRGAFWSSCLLISTLCGAAGASVKLAWDASPSADVVRYVVSMGTNEGGPYPEQWPVAGRDNTTLVITSLAPGRYYFVAQAVNSSNLWSDFSNQLEVSIPEPPTLTIIESPSVSLTGVVYRATNVLGPWRELMRLPPVTVPFDGEMGFFRLGLEWSPPPTGRTP